jgi:hypothetical protein
MGRQFNVLTTFNRLVVILLAWSVLGVTALFARDPANTISILERYLDPLRTSGPAWLLGAIFVSGLAFVVLLVEVWPGARRCSFEVRVDGGTIEYEARVVVGAIEHDLALLQGPIVRQVDVAGGGNRVRVRIRLETSATRDPADLAAQVSGRIRDTIKQLGLETQSIRMSMEPPTESRTVAVQRQAQSVS